jgi:hypothetical protein
VEGLGFWLGVACTYSTLCGQELVVQNKIFGTFQRYFFLENFLVVFGIGVDAKIEFYFHREGRISVLYRSMVMVPNVKVLLAAEKAAHGLGEFYNRFLKSRRSPWRAFGKFRV